MRSKKAAMLNMAALSIVLGSGIAGAQAIPATNASTGADDGTLETIVVTATKRSESQQNVASQVTALSGAALEDLHATDFTGFAPFVPGLSFQSAGPTGDLIAIRGITTGGAQLSGAVGMYVDEVPVGASSSFGLAFQTLPTSTFDLARVEVLNGPQGTVYGSNALGGTIKYVTAAPDPKAFSAKVEAEGADTAHGTTGGGVRALLNVPLLGDRVALRIDGVDQTDSGYATDPFNHRSNQGKGHTLGGRVSLLAQMTPDLDLRLSASAQKIEATGFAVSLRDPVTGAPTYGPYDQNFTVAQPSDASLHLYSAVLNWNLHVATLTAVSAYQENSGDYLDDVSGVYNPLLASVFGVQPYGLYVNTSTSKFTQEIRLASQSNKSFEWLVGGFYSNERTHEFVDLLDTSTPAGTLFGFAPFYGVLPSTYSEFAGFADGTVYFTPKLDLTVGMRYSQNRQRYQQDAYGLFVVPTNPTQVTHEDARSTQNVTTFLFNPRYHVSDELMVYGKAASGYRPGGPNFVLALGHGSPTFDADRLWNYELGEKARFFGDRASLDFDLYDIEWKKIQLTVNNGGINQLENGGDARIQGAELAFAFRSSPSVTLSGTAAYTDARLTTTVPGLGISYTGARLPLSPKTSFAVSAKYHFTAWTGYDGDVLISDYFVGGRTAGYAGSLLSPEYDLPSYNTVDLSAILRSSHGFEVDAYLKNVFDQRGQVSATTLANEYNPSAPVPVTLSRPRTIGVVLKYSFGP